MNTSKPNLSPHAFTVICLMLAVRRLQRFVEYVTASVVGTAVPAATADPRGAAVPVTPSVAAFASGVAAELAPVTRDLLAIETTGELPAAAPSVAESGDDGGPWWQPHAPARGGELTLLAVLAASQPAMRRLAFLAEVRPARRCSREPPQTCSSGPCSPRQAHDSTQPRL